MKLLLIRHGESAPDTVKGILDLPLTKVGENQAQLMANWVNENYKIDKIYTSTLQRAFQTATCLSEITGLELIPDSDLVEFNFGIVAGNSQAEAREKFPTVPNIPIHESCYDQETLLDFRHRTERSLSKIKHENQCESTIAVVCHAKTIDQLYHAFLSLPISKDISFFTYPTGIHEWEITANGCKVLKSNSQVHLNL